MLAEELSPRESATDEELRAAEWLAGRFSGWGYEVELQDFEAVEIGRATRLVVVGRGMRWMGWRVSGSGTVKGCGCLPFRRTRPLWPRRGTRWRGNGVRGPGHGRGLLGG